MLAPTAAMTALVVTLTLAPAPATGTVASSTSPVATSGRTTATLQVAAARTRRAYSPHTGVKLTEPRNRYARGRIMRHVLKSIGATRRGQKIRIISWNLASRRVVRKLINAHERGVSVRLLMSQQKADGQPRSGDFWRLRRNLRDRQNQNRPMAMRSWARGCDRSCRGRRGIAHSKLFLFSKVGGSEHVVMSTSANLTDNAVRVQWNDLYTYVGNRRMYNWFDDRFREMARDKPVRRGYRSYRAHSVTGYVYPHRGPNAHYDRVKRTLRKITCRGARGQTGINGRTRIRVAQDAIIDRRGQDIARILRRKWQNGCNIKIVYALINNKAKRILRHTSRGPVPMKQIFRDTDGDGIFDWYLHSKVMAVSGWYGRDRSTRIAWQGSENWSGLATMSDEQGFEIRRGGAEGTYARFVDYLYRKPPLSKVSATATLRTARALDVDPYAEMREELGLPTG